QAEDGIRAFHVTGVQTCALPIFGVHLDGAGAGGRGAEIGRGVAEAAGKDGEDAGLGAVDIGAAGPVALDRCLLRKSWSRGQQDEDGGGGWTHLGTQLLLRSNFPNPGSLVSAIKARSRSGMR